MGACCCDLLEKDEIHTNQSRLRLLQSKVMAQYHTENDAQFTYYLHYFHQHTYLQKVLQEYREAYERTEDSTAYQFNTNQIQSELQELNKYTRDCDNSQSQLFKKIQKDQKILANQDAKFGELIPYKQLCMIKIQIQGFEMIQGISKFNIMKCYKIGNEQKKSEQFIFVTRSKNEMIYRQLVFPTVKSSKIKIITEPIVSTVTVDVEDIMKNEAVCSVFKFQTNDQDYGFIALRMQFVTSNSEFNSKRRQKLTVLQKELKLCASNKAGSRMSFSVSEAGSHKQTFVSDHVSQYQNQYQA